MALVLTMKPGDRVTIGDDTEVKIIAMQGRQVRVAIVAPKEVPILRDNAKLRQKKTS